MDFREAVERVIEYVVRDRLYLRAYECTVERQAADGSLDLLPDDERIRGTGLSGVPIYHGLPGVTVTVTPGARVLLQFVSGDPQRPFASLWRSGDIEEISFNGGTAPVARQGDPVACYWPASVAFTGLLNGVSFSGTMTIATPGAGLIESGAARVKA
jgi:hypothetical protein